MGTSTCDMLVAPVADMQNKLVRGICGQVDGSIIPGMIGMEAGQSAFGDAYAWFANLLAWPLQNVLNETSLISQETAQQLTDEVRNKLIAKLSDAASKITVTEETELAIDWLNGRRTPDANQALTGAFSGLDLGTDAPAMFRALAEATCFGAKAIVDRFRAEGVPVNGIIALGGVARKSPFVMQLMADTLNMPIRVHSSEQTCAIGAAMFAATAAGLYPVVEDAMQAMGQGFDMHYQPNREKAALLSKRYQRYTDLGTYIEKQTAIL
jgi:L-ribulokinase